MTTIPLKKPREAGRYAGACVSGPASTASPSPESGGPWARLAYGVCFSVWTNGTEKARLRTALGEQQEVWRPLWFIVLFSIIALEFLMATTGGRKKEAEDAGLDAEGQGSR
jgi:hypothetical protein